MHYFFRHSRVAYVGKEYRLTKRLKPSNYKGFDIFIKELDLSPEGASEANGKILSIDDLSADAQSKITPAQQARLNQEEGLFSHLTESDFTGAEKELNGIPLTKEDGSLVLKNDGTVYNHIQEVSDAYRGIEKVKRAYEGILKNPNLDLELRGLFQSRLDNIISYIERINALFDPFGGIRPPK